MGKEVRVVLTFWGVGCMSEKGHEGVLEGAGKEWFRILSGVEVAQGL